MDNENWSESVPYGLAVRAKVDGRTDGDQMRNASIWIVKVSGGSNTCAVQAGVVEVSMCII